MFRPALLASLLLAAPAGAQSFQDAVRGNVGLAVDLCIQFMGREQSLVGAYNAAGFIPAGQEGQSGNRLHRYTAPADTMQAAVTSYSCEITTRHMGISASVPLSREVLQHRHGTNFKEFAGSGTRSGPDNPCVTYSFFGRGNLFLVMYAGSIAPPPNRACVEDGTTRIWFEVPG